MTDLPVRYPQIDYEACFPHWAPHLEFAMTMNANSITPVYLEPYIIRVLADAKKLLDPVKDAALIREVDWFVAQESQHYRQHQKFNRVFQTPRYPQVETIGKQYGVELEAFRTGRSLIFNLAYTEGFESGGGAFYRVWFEQMGAYRFGAKEAALHLYDWHFAEEFEHREVAYKLYMRLAAQGNIVRRIWYGYFYRIFGVLFMLSHGGKYGGLIRKHLLSVERSEMTPQDARASVRREKRYHRFMFWATMKHLVSVLTPWYNPARKPAPMGLTELLTDFEPGGRHARTKEAVAG